MTDDRDGLRPCIVVDDDSLVLELYRRRLRGLGFRLETFADAELALEHLAASDTSSAALWFIDQNMPRVDGIDLLERLADVASPAPGHRWLCSAVPLSSTVRARADRLGVGEFCKERLRERSGLVEWLNVHTTIASR